MREPSVTGYWVHIDWRMMKEGFLIAMFPFAFSFAVGFIARRWQLWRLRKSIRPRRAVIP